ncbi:MAG: TRAP transporter small permease subunit [Deltaproteobacteria bacterium]|nr:TRAP transporter small permease subunit [Deltaproteobacteria bacterium]
MTRLIRAVDSAVARVETAALVTILAVMAFLAVVQVTLKLFGAGIPWLEMFVRYLVVWVGFLGGAVASFQARHITIDVVSRFVKGRVRRVFGVVVNLVSAILVAVLIVVSLYYIQRKIGDRSIAFAIPRAGGNIEFLEWWFATIIPVGFGLMGWHFMVQTWYYIVDEQPEQEDLEEDDASIDGGRS